MAQAIVDRARGVLCDLGPVHRLQREALEGEALESLGCGCGLRIDQLQLVPLAQHKLAAALRADADPVEPLGRRDRAIGLDADLEAAGMERIDQSVVDLQQRLAAGQHHVAVLGGFSPLRGDGVGEFHGGGVTAAESAVGADEIRVAELTGRISAVGLAAAPEVAAGKTAEHGCASGMGAFALQGQEDFLDRVTHWSLLKLSIRAGSGPAGALRLRPSPRSWQH